MVLLSIIKTGMQYTCHLLYVYLVYAFCGLTLLANLHHHLICALSLSLLTPFVWLRSVTRNPLFYGHVIFYLRPLFQERKWGVQQGLDVYSLLVSVQTGTAEHAVADFAYVATSP